jgi:hypothetical protein
MSALQTVPEGTLEDRLNTLEGKVDEVLRLQHETAALANQLADIINSFDVSSIPAPFRAMLGL